MTTEAHFAFNEARAASRRVVAALVAAPFFAGIFGCVAPGTRPQDMSASGHDEAAAQSDSLADMHAPQIVTCPTQEGPCWTSVVHPPQDERRQEERYRTIAAKHRAAAQELRDAEARACAGVGDRDRVLSPFSHHEDIAGAAPIYLTSKTGRKLASNLRGAVVTFRPVPSLTADWLQRIVNCHVARSATLGHPLEDMPDCPLVCGKQATTSRWRSERMTRRPATRYGSAPANLHRSFARSPCLAHRRPRLPVALRRSRGCAAHLTDSKSPRCCKWMLRKSK